MTPFQGSSSRLHQLATYHLAKRSLRAARPDGTVLIMASDEFDPVVRRRKSRDLRRSRDISDESSDRDTRRRSSTDGGALLGAEAPRLLPGISNMRLVGLSCLVIMPYTRACARDAMLPPSPSPRRPARRRESHSPFAATRPRSRPPPPPPRPTPLRRTVHSALGADAEYTQGAAQRSPREHCCRCRAPAPAGRDGHRGSSNFSSSPQLTTATAQGRGAIELQIHVIGMQLRQKGGLREGYAQRDGATASRIEGHGCCPIKGTKALADPCLTHLSFTLIQKHHLCNFISSTL